MKKSYIIILFLIFATFSQGQTSKKDRSDEDFAFIENSTDTSLLKFIRTYKCISKKGDDIPSLYRTIKIQALNMSVGANCYKFKSFTRDSLGTMELTLDTYYGSDTILDINYSNHEKNSVYIFSDDKFKERYYSFKVNNKKKIIKSGTYFKCIVKEDDLVKINKGGLFGTTVKIYWQENKLSRYFTMSGFGLSDMPISPYRMGVSFTTGKFKYMDKELGRLLAVILKQQE